VQRKSAAGGYAPPAPPPPANPKGDGKFTKMVGDLKKTGTDLKKHPPGKAEAKKASDAAVPPGDDKESQAKAAKADKMSGAKKGSFDKEAFINAVMSAAEQAAPGISAQRAGNGQGASTPAAPPALQAFAAGVLARQQARVKKGARGISRLGTQQLHRARIQVKRLRYATEFFLPFAEVRRSGGELRAVTALQWLLGRLNDDAVAWTLLDRLARADTSTDYQQAVGYLRGWCARDAVECRSRVEPAWKKFLER